eukprot:6423020-Pyramimonas_sp.AAC.2
MTTMQGATHRAAALLVTLSALPALCRAVAAAVTQRALVSRGVMIVSHPPGPAPLARRRKAARASYKLHVEQRLLPVPVACVAKLHVEHHLLMAPAARVAS